MGTKLTCARSAIDAQIQTGYEGGPASIAVESGRSHPLVIGGNETRSAPEFEVRPPFDRRIPVGKFQTATPSLTGEAVRATRPGTG